MKRKELIVEFNTKIDGDEGYGEYIELQLIAKILKFQDEKYRGTDIIPLIQIVGDSIQIFKEVDCGEDEADAFAASASAAFILKL